MSTAPILEWPAWPMLDWLMLGALAVSVLLGLARGFVAEVMSLVGWVVAWVAANWYAATVAAWLPVGIEPQWRPLVAAVLVFVVTLIAWGLLTRLLRGLVHATPLALPDRLLGAAFGLARGAVLLLLATALLLWTRAPCQPWWQASRGAAWAVSALRAVQAWLPSQGFDFSFTGTPSCAASSG